MTVIAESTPFCIVEAPPTQEPVPVYAPYEYHHLQFTEASSPGLVDLAWKVHAEGYLSSKFVNPDAITEDGFLVADLDKSRGPHTDYFFAFREESPNDCATMRKFNLCPDQTFRDLPSFDHCEPGMSAEGVNYLTQLEAQGMHLVEIAALARSKNADREGIFEIFRRTVHGAIGKDEAWFFGIVTKTQNVLANQYGADNFTILGADIPIKDSRVNEGIALRPAVLFPDLFLDNILASYEKATRQRERVRLMRSFMYFSDGLEQSQLSEVAFEAREHMVRSLTEAA